MNSALPRQPSAGLSAQNRYLTAGKERILIAVHTTLPDRAQALYGLRRDALGDGDRGQVVAECDRERVVDEGCVQRAPDAIVQTQSEFDL